MEGLTIVLVDNEKEEDMMKPGQVLGISNVVEEAFLKQPRSGCNIHYASVSSFVLMSMLMMWFQ